MAARCGISQLLGFHLNAKVSQVTPGTRGSRVRLPRGLFYKGSTSTGPAAAGLAAAQIADWDTTPPRTAQGDDL